MALTLRERTKKRINYYSRNTLVYLHSCLKTSLSTTYTWPKNLLLLEYVLYTNISKSSSKAYLPSSKRPFMNRNYDLGDLSLHHGYAKWWKHHEIYVFVVVIRSLEQSLNGTNSVLLSIYYTWKLRVSFYLILPLVLLLLFYKMQIWLILNYSQVDFQFWKSE